MTRWLRAAREVGVRTDAQFLVVGLSLPREERMEMEQVPGGRSRSGLGQGLWDTQPRCQDGGVSPANDIFKPSAPPSPPPPAVHATLFGQRVCWVGWSYFNGWRLYMRREGALGTDPGAQGEPHVVTGA